MPASFIKGLIIGVVIFCMIPVVIPCLDLYWEFCFQYERNWVTKHKYPPVPEWLKNSEERYFYFDGQCECWKGGRGEYRN